MLDYMAAFCSTPTPMTDQVVVFYLGICLSSSTPLEEIQEKDREEKKMNKNNGGDERASYLVSLN